MFSIGSSHQMAIETSQKCSWVESKCTKQTNSKLRLAEIKAKQQSWFLFQKTKLVCVSKAHNSYCQPAVISRERVLPSQAPQRLNATSGNENSVSSYKSNQFNFLKISLRKLHEFTRRCNENCSSCRNSENNFIYVIEFPDYW
jgi:hypothetical protein